ncbi:MAG TPA: cupin domain-containing protein [Dehalococcoidia bacterium]|nr:cupin domain-containing protein [Dehalococcoidia bacterium]
MANGMEAVVLRPGESRGRFDRALKVGAADTGGAFALRVTDALPPGRWIDEHIHQREEEAWYVISGVLTFRISGISTEAPAGSFILVPRGTAHGFGNTGTGPAGYIERFSPAGMEGYFEERFALEQAPRTANADYAGLDPAMHAALARKYHMRFV